MYLYMQYRPPVIKTAGFSAIVFIPAITMTAEPSRLLYDKIKNIGIETLIADVGYKTLGIAKLLIDDGIKPLMPYKRPMTKEGFFKKYEYAYDEYYDYYICSDNKLTYSTANRDGYREYKSCGMICETCLYLAQCTGSKDHIKIITRHIWELYMEMCEDIRQILGMKDLYSLRKETMDSAICSCLGKPGWK